MKIALIGIRGIPVIYSGFESFAKNLATALANKGENIYVYCRSPYVDKKVKKYKEVNLISLFTLKNKNFESIIHSFIATFHACFFLRPQIIYYLGVGNAIFTLFPRFFGVRTIINVDGLDWRREKWGIIAKSYLRISQYLATIFPNATITDSLYMKEYYLKQYEKKTTYISYYFDRKLLILGKKSEDKTLFRYGLKKRKYFVWVGRMVPDNHLEELIYAFKKLKTNHKCVIIGDDTFASSYKKFILNLSADDKRIIFTGFLEKEKYAQLVRSSFCYVETKRSGGSHPSLIEAMGLGCFIVSDNNIANKKIIEKGAIFYENIQRKKTLLKILRLIVNERNEHIFNKYRKTSRSICIKKFNENKILSQYDHLFNYLIDYHAYD
jgi:glycosyltransferase involved in cell wall biosynthesis